MPRNFTPSSREAVRETAEDMPGVFQAVPCGPGVAVVFDHDWNQSNGWTGLAEKHGWYLDRRIPKEGGDHALLMPITEVPE